MTHYFDKLNDLESKKKIFLEAIYRSSLSELDGQYRRGIVKISLQDWDLDGEDWDIYESMLIILEEELTAVKLKLSTMKIDLELIDFELDNF